MSRPEFTMELTAQRADIDELGHVNNAVWVQWIQKVAIAHWDAAAPDELKDEVFWVVTRHEIDYLRALEEGETVTARTWIDPEAKGARSVRHMEFEKDGKVHVRAATQWAMIDKASARPARVRARHLAPFTGTGD
ncbi:acyl-CoA thioesterase [Sphingomicrobium aestuariivivum]|uniref:acyl-CoA thioesterase n=1 Tax=Sphingomicrobium aestuariivivum TaxID=1582356 RepID=UPI001FD6D228|nr:acyl-CoA thioesterase [Sphingomicrobium aestuariivivum]MCJ8190914.1 acyl-CoA thioesterase [Sphingomicrobium aestuariivivum]